MKRLAVFVATTSGPVRIERITRERAPQSMVCLRRSSTVLPISSAYDSFVRRGSGVIEKTFGPFEEGAFRLDLSEGIETGESWQLGVFIAHAISAAPKEMQLSDLETADQIVWLTGHVDYDLGVGSVGHLAEKIHASRDILAAWAAAGKSVVMIVHDGADRDAVSVLGIPEGVALVAVRTASDALQALGLKVPHASVHAKKPDLRWITLGFAFFALASFTLYSKVQHRADLLPPVEHLEAVALETQPAPPAVQSVLKAPIVIEPVEEPPMREATLVASRLPVDVVEAPAAPVIPAPKFVIYERRAPEGHTCAEVQFGAVDALKVPVAATTSVSNSQLPGLCGLAVAVDNGARENFVAVVLDVVSGKLLYGTSRPDVFSGATAFDGRQEWAIDLPRRLSGPFEIKLAALSAGKTVAEQAQWFDSQPDEGAAVRELSAKGVATAMIHHRVSP